MRHSCLWARLVVLIAATAAAPALFAQSCDRDCLKGVMTQYLDALVHRSPARLPLAADVRFTENSQELKLGEGLWKTVSGWGPYRLDIIDVREGLSGAMVLANVGGKPAMMVVRLKVAGGKITEVETLVTHNRAEGAIFAPAALRTPSEAMTTAPPPAQLDSREEAIRIAKLYPEGLRTGSFVKADTPFAPDAYRFENGQLMAGPGCTFIPGCDLIKEQRIPTLAGITTRVAAVDEQLGIVWLNMNFGPGSVGPGRTLMVWEAFKVYGGQIHAVEAFMRSMPAGSGSGWGE